MLHERTCAYKPCSRLFTTDHYLKKFCSPVCYQHGHEYVCAYDACKKVFYSKQHKPKYCSISCGVSDRAVRDEEAIRAYLLANIQKPDDVDGCWIWIGSLHKHGYGQATVNRKQEGAHRVVYHYFRGPITDDLHVLHGPTCKTRACVNPLHMHLGTEVDNVRDRVEFGNNCVGSRSPKAKMTEIQALHILQDFHDKGMDDWEIAEKRRKPIKTVRAILNRETWKHIAPGKYPAIGNRRTRLNADIVREMRRLCEQEQWTWQAITAHINEIYPDVRLTYPMTWNVCNYKTWKSVKPASLEVESPMHDCQNTGPYCDCCGECLVCYGNDPCYAPGSEQHSLA